MTSAATRKSMQGNTRANTKPELEVRRALRAAGYTGYRLQWKKAPGRPDIAFPGRKIAIFVNGCFWHHHIGCRYATMPSSHSSFWLNKFVHNRARDSRNLKKLQAMGWKVITIWECELKKDKREETFEYVLTQLEEE